MLDFSRGFNLGPALFIIIYQLLTLVTVPIYLVYGTLHLETFLIALLYYLLGGLAITAGYHRLFSHKSYETKPFVEAFWLFFASTAMQGSAIRWCFDHRLHHAKVDTVDDPYSIQKGFWYAHCLWILEKPREIEEKMVSDLLARPLIRWQHKYKKLVMFGSNILFVSIAGLLTGDFLGAFFIIMWLRLFLLHHCTWFINSLAHTWGERPFSLEQSAVNNYIISLLTFGEGYHNFHHTYANDYRNGICWFQFDPTKWLIWSLASCGLASKLRRIDEVTMKKKLFSEGHERVLARASSLIQKSREELELKLASYKETIQAQLAAFNEAKEALKSAPHAERFNLKKRFKEEKRRLKRVWREWMRFYLFVESI